MKYLYVLDDKANLIYNILCGVSHEQFVEDNFCLKYPEYTSDKAKYLDISAQNAINKNSISIYSNTQITLPILSYLGETVGNNFLMIRKSIIYLGKWESVIAWDINLNCEISTHLNEYKLVGYKQNKCLYLRKDNGLYYFEGNEQYPTKIFEFDSNYQFSSVWGNPSNTLMIVHDNTPFWDIWDIETREKRDKVRCSLGIREKIVFMDNNTFICSTGKPAAWKWQNNQVVERYDYYLEDIQTLGNKTATFKSSDGLVEVQYLENEKGSLIWKRSLDLSDKVLIRGKLVDSGLGIVGWLCGDSSICVFNQKEIRILDIKNGNIVSSSKIPYQRIEDLFLKDNNFISIASNTITFWNKHTGEILFTLYHNQRFSSYFLFENNLFFTDRNSQLFKLSIDNINLEYI